MNDKTRKRIWPVSLITLLGVIAMLAVVWSSDSVQAQSPPPVWFVGDGLTATAHSDTQINLSWNTASGATSYKLERKTGSAAYSITGGALTGATHNDMGLMASTTYTYRITAINTSGETVGDSEVMPITMTAEMTGDGVAMLKSSSTSGSANVELTFTSLPLTADDVAKIGRDGGSVELFLEDDFVVPGSISPGSIYFTLTNEPSSLTGGGGRVRAVYGVEVNDGDFFAGDNDWAIQVYMPDLYTASVDAAAGFQGPEVGQTLTMVITKSAGIRNPSEEGKHSVGYKFLGTSDDPDKDGEMKLKTNVLDDSGMSTSEVATYAKIALSADDGGRAAPLKITGSGFNDGTTASVEVLEDADGMVDDGAGGTRAISCQDVLATGISLGSAAVGDNDQFELDITVHQDQFKAGAVNYICAKDNEAPTNRFAEEPKVFILTKSLTVSPGSVSSGDEVTIKPRDFPGSLSIVNLGGSKVYKASDDIDLAEVTTSENHFDIDADGSDFVFDMPGGLSGTVQIAVMYYQIHGGVDDRVTPADADVEGAKDVSTTKNVFITVNPASLSLSSTEVAPNATVIISGSGFNDNSCIETSDITIKDIVSKRLVVDPAGVQTGSCTEGDYIQTTSSGEFTATISIWTVEGVDGNPALDDGDYKIEAEDIHGFKGSATVTILEPTVSVMPEMVSPRDFITISGENWPISTADADHEVTIMVDGRNRSVNIDGNGRFRYQYQLRSNIGIGEEHEVMVEFEGDGGSIEEEATFEVHDAGIMLTPTEAAPGQTISVEIEGMPPYTLVDHVNIDGVNRLGSQNLNTDRHGNVMITGVLVPYLDPGFYPVQVTVGEETRVVQLEVLAEAGGRRRRHRFAWRGGRPGRKPGTDIPLQHQQQGLDVLRSARRVRGSQHPDRARRWPALLDTGTGNAGKRGTQWKAP